MRAALRLRLKEARRRGGLPLLASGILVVGWVAMAGGDTPDGRYGLASDLAATFAYLAALFYGALPLATDRERKRSYLPGASPVTPWGWALGNALGAASLGLIGGLALFSAAGIGAAMGGGIKTHATTRIGDHGTAYLPVTIRVPKTATHMRFVPRVHLSVEQALGTTDSATVAVDGKPYEFFPNRPIVVPVESERVLLESKSEEHTVGIDVAATRAYVGERPFLTNALGAGLAPSLGAAALAALGAAASANLSAAVAALFTALVLALASLKGFVLDTFEYEGARQQMENKHEGHGHEQHPEASQGLRNASQALVKSMLAALPDLSELDQTGSVAIGDWTGTSKSGEALKVLLITLALATALGGFGVHARRLP